MCHMLPQSSPGGGHVVSRIGLLATNIVQWQPRDESRIESDFVLGTAVKNVFVLTLVRKKTCYNIRLVYKLFSQCTYSDMRVFLRFKQLPIVIFNVKCVNTNIDGMYINPDTSLVK